MTEVPQPGPDERNDGLDEEQAAQPNTPHEPGLGDVLAGDKGPEAPKGPIGDSRAELLGKVAAPSILGGGDTAPETAAEPADAPVTAPETPSASAAEVVPPATPEPATEPAPRPAPDTRTPAPAEATPRTEPEADAPAEPDAEVTPPAATERVAPPTLEADAPPTPAAAERAVTPTPESESRPEAEKTPEADAPAEPEKDKVDLEDDRVDQNDAVKLYVAMEKAKQKALDEGKNAEEVDKAAIEALNEQVARTEREKNEKRLRDEEKKKRDRAAELVEADEVLPEPLPVPEIDKDELQKRLDLAEQVRYEKHLKDEAEKAEFRALSKEEKDAKAAEFAEHKPRDKDSNIPQIEFMAYIASLSEAALKDFLQKDIKEQDEAILLDRKAKDKAKAKERAQSVKTKEEAPVMQKERSIPETTLNKGLVRAFVATLSDSEYITFMNLSPEMRDELVEKWLSESSVKLLNEAEKERVNALDKAARKEYDNNWLLEDGAAFIELAEEFLSRLKDSQQKEFNKLPYDEKIKNLIIFRDGGDPPGFESSTEKYNGNVGLQSPSLRIYGIYRNDATGDDFYQIITEHDLMHNARSPEELKAERNLWERIKLNVAGKWFTLVLKAFHYEAKLAEENKHAQEMIRGIVDTGPDDYERLVFAQKHGSVYLNYEGKEVSAEVVRKAQKWALHNPSRFQALCHYELSKREETEQAVLWEEIFEMMAHHHYNKYAMFGVVVGLQFMNKPSYLAWKNAKIEWMPIYEEVNGEPVMDDEGNPKVKKWTEENAYETNIFGKKVLKKDADGNPVEIGKTMRSTQRARFETIDLKLQPGDQEYDEKVADPDHPGAFKDKYETRYKIIRDPETGEEIRREAYKVKKIVALKHDKFAHELSGKFMSFQYAFRSSDVSLMLDEARWAKQTALRLLRAGDVHSKELQVALYVLRSFKIVADTARMSGGTNSEGSQETGQATQEEMQRMQQEKTNKLAERIKRQSEKEGKPMDIEEARNIAETSVKEAGGYPPKISGTAEANALFLELTALVDDMQKRIPIISTIRKSDYEAIQNEFYSQHHGHGGGHGDGHSPSHGISRRENRRRHRNNARYRAGV